MAVVGVLLLGPLAGCESLPFSSDDDPQKQMARSATVWVFDPFTQEDMPVEVTIKSSDSAELQEAIRLMQLNESEYPAAIGVLNDRVAAKPTDATAHLLLGLLNEQQEHWEAARDAYRQSNLLKSNTLAQEGYNRVDEKLRGG